MTAKKSPVSNETSKDTEVWEALRRATEEFGLCPNRVWSVARLDWEQENILPRLMSRRPGEPMQSHQGHNACTIDFCEHSQSDFTSVTQRHENQACATSPCAPIRHRFPMRSLEKALQSGRLAAWSLDGKTILEPNRPFMAISHVWSDGTGTGAWGQDEARVNRCLYKYFSSIAERFQCEGIWWDTICIPKDKAARSRAINTMHLNYEDAQITLVHDCYLRQWTWFDAETACFAIIMSPWFSRGWTALELARSRKVKVVFAGSVIKDLDEDILATTPDPEVAYSDRHRIASNLISNLRSGRVTSLDGLLQALGSRSTSWPRDKAIIAGLLTNVGTIGPDTTQQRVYQDVLRKLGRLRHAHLFHKSTTMSGGFSWCPTNVFSMENCPDRGFPPLKVHENGHVTGRWRMVSGLRHIGVDRYNWEGVHDLIKARLCSALQSDGEGRHRLLVEPRVDRAITRGLLVKMVEDGMPSKVEFIGPVYFQPPLSDREMGLEDVITSLGTVEVTIGHWEEKENDRGGGGNHVQPDPYPSRLKNQDREQGKIYQQQLFLKAAEEGREATIRELFRSISLDSPDARTMIDAADSQGRTALSLAASNGHQSTAQTLLELGADPNFTGPGGWTPLHYATWRCNKLMADILLSNAANIASADDLGRCALHLASERGDRSMVTLLLQRGADPNMQCERRRQTALHRAAWAGSARVAMRLLSHSRIDPNIHDARGRTPLHVAAEYAHSAVIRVLLDKRADSCLTDYWGRIPLHVAAMGGEEEIVQALLDGPDSTGTTAALRPDLEGWRPSHLAAQAGHEAAAKLLWKRERQAEIRDPLATASSDAWKLLHSAARGGLDWVVRRFLSENPSCSLATDSQGRLPLHRACEGGIEGVVRLLLTSQADGGLGMVDTQDHNGRTPLHWAAHEGHAAVARLLLEKGADLVVEDQVGETPLWWAIENGHEPVVRMILDVGVNLHGESHGGGKPKRLVGRKGYQGRTPISRAAEKGHEGVVRLLLERGTHPNSADKEGRTPIGRAAENGYEAVVEAFLEKGTHPNQGDRVGGRTPLGWAAAKGHASVVEVLLKKGANANWSGFGHATPLNEAVRKGHDDIVELLRERGCSEDTSLFSRQGPPNGAGVQRGNKSLRERLLGKLFS